MSPAVADLTVSDREHSEMRVDGAQPLMRVEAGISIFAEQRDLFGQTELVLTKHVPGNLFGRYLTEALKAVTLKRLEDGTWFAELPDFEGVWGTGESIEVATAELRDVLSDWLVIKIEQSDRDIPVVGGISLNVL